jgi:hypothetical protein
MKINLAQLSTKDLATLSQRTITVSDEPTFSVIKDNPLLTAVKTEYDFYDSLYTKKAFSGRGEELIQADNERDAPFGALKNILLGHTKASSSPYQQEAKELYAVVEKYGIALDRLKFAEETAQLVKLLEELDKTENVAKIEHLLLTPIVTQLKEAQVAFEKLFNELAGENADLRQTESATSHRRNLEAALRNYFNVVTAMSALSGWKELYTKLDEVAKAANNRKPGSDKKDDNSTQTK